MKSYVIVTNDAYEMPLSKEIIGAAAVAKKLNMPLWTLRCYLRRGFPKKSKIKVVAVQDKQITDLKAYNKKRYCMNGK